MNTAQHIQKAERNQRFVTETLMSFLHNYPDWVSVVAFYSALHYVEAILATYNLHFEHHVERNRQVSLLLQDIESEYLNLYDLARNARYGRIGDAPSEGDAEQAVNTDLPTIEEFVRSRLTH